MKYVYVRMTKIQFSPRNKEERKSKDDYKDIILKKEMYNATTEHYSNFQSINWCKAI